MPHPADQPQRAARHSRDPGPLPAESGTPSPAKRPPVDVVVPFAGAQSELEALVGRLAALEVAGDDRVFVVDNRRRPCPTGGREGVEVVAAPEQQSSYFARNRGCERGDGEWILFLDADVEVPADIIDRYFAIAVGAETGVLVGSVLNRSPGRVTVASRYAELVRLIDQDNTLAKQRPYAQTANCAIRRRAFEQVGGFTESIRSAGDADLCFRLADAGWQFERRPRAEAAHAGRTRLGALLGQTARHASGLRWLDRRYPGSGRRRSALGVARTVVGGLALGVVSILRGRRDQAIVHLVGAPVAVAQWVGYRVPNRPWREMLRRHGDPPAGTSH